MIPCEFLRTEVAGPDTWIFYFLPQRQYTYIAGQFVDVYLPLRSGKSLRHKRWFTLSSSPTEEHLTITTKIGTDPTPYKQQLRHLKRGDTLYISDAMGDFVLPIDRHRPLIFACAGIGITPVRSMLKWLADKEQKREITTLYMESYPHDFIYTDLINTMSSDVHYYNRKAGVQSALDAQEILRAVSRSVKPLVYISGPETWVETVVADLRETGFPSSAIVTDYFPGYEDIY